MNFYDFKPYVSFWTLKNEKNTKVSVFFSYPENYIPVREDGSEYGLSRTPEMHYDPANQSWTVDFIFQETEVPAPKQTIIFDWGFPLGINKQLEIRSFKMMKNQKRELMSKLLINQSNAFIFPEPYDDELPYPRVYFFKELHEGKYRYSYQVMFQEKFSEHNLSSTETLNSSGRKSEVKTEINLNPKNQNSNLVIESWKPVCIPYHFPSSDLDTLEVSISIPVSNDGTQWTGKTKVSYGDADEKPN
jgi:hypothetical protein